jgi:hypothetical protein
MRFIKKSEAYLGFNEDTVDIEFFYYRSGQPNAPRWNEDVMEEIEQLFLKKYGDRPPIHGAISGPQLGAAAHRRVVNSLQLKSSSSGRTNHIACSNPRVTV